MTQQPIIFTDFNADLLKALREREHESRFERPDYPREFVDIDDFAHFERLRGVRK